MTVATNNVTLSTICTPSEDVVAREIEGVIVIVPLVAGIGDADDEIFSLNETGQAIWQQLDGQRTLGDMALALSDAFDVPLDQLEADVLGFADVMMQHRILAVC